MSEADESYLHHLRGLFESEGESFHEKIYDFFPGIIYVYSTETRKLRYVNKRITDVLGFSYDDVKGWDNDFSKFIFKDDVDLVARELEKFSTLKDEDSHSYKCRFNKKEGDWMHFSVMGKILRRDDNGKPTSLLLVAQDINQQTHSDEELKIIRELAEDNEELLQFGNWNWTRATDSLKWSRGMYILMDYEPDVQEPKMTMARYLESVVPEDRPTILAGISRAEKNKDTIVEFKYVVSTAKQSEKIFYSKGKVIFDEKGDILNIVGITRDITESTKLYDNLDNYKTMVMEKEDFLNHGSWEFDVNNDRYIWSDGMFRLFGYDPEKDKTHLVLNGDVYRKHITAEYIEKGDQNLESKIREKGNYLWEYEITTSTGETKMLESFGKIARDRDGKITRIIGTTRDVTQLKKYEHELEQKITELDRSNRELEEFAYAASHDLHEPLRKIATLSDRLQAKFGDVLQEDGKKFIERIQQSVKSGRVLIDGLMEFSRITADSEVSGESDLNVILKDVKADLELKIEENQAIIKAAALPVLRISPLHVKQLFFNIILNSLKFRKPDIAPLIDIKSRPLSRNEIQQYHLNAKLSYHAISIEDNGIGFEHEYEKKIFQMFHRLHGKSEYPGSGIGLALCKKIVEQHKGIIFANGTPGQGAVFTIILPEKNL